MQRRSAPSFFSLDSFPSPLYSHFLYLSLFFIILCLFIALFFLISLSLYMYLLFCLSVFIASTVYISVSGYHNICSVFYKFVNSWYDTLSQFNFHREPLNHSRSNIAFHTNTPRVYGFYPEKAKSAGCGFAYSRVSDKPILPAWSLIYTSTFLT